MLKSVPRVTLRSVGSVDWGGLPLSEEEEDPTSAPRGAEGSASAASGAVGKGPRPPAAGVPVREEMPRKQREAAHFRRPLARQEIKEWFAKREIDKNTLKDILVQHYLSAASGAGAPASAASGAQPSGASGSQGPAPAASAVSGAGGPGDVEAGASAFGGARANVISGIDIERNSKNEYFIERGAPTIAQMVKFVWGEKIQDPAWKLPRRTLPNEADCRDVIVRDVFADAPYDTEFEMMDASDENHWCDGSGIAPKRIVRYKSYIQPWTPVSISLSKLLRHSAAKPRKGNRGIPCDSAGWFKITDILAIRDEYWGGRRMTLELLSQLGGFEPQVAISGRSTTGPHQAGG